MRGFWYATLDIIGPLKSVEVSGLIVAAGVTKVLEESPAAGASIH